MTPIPEASLNRYVINSPVHLKQYIGKCGRELLSSTAVKLVKEEYNTLWPKEIAKRVATLLESLFLGNGWKGIKKNTPIGNIRDYWKSLDQILLGGGILSGTDGSVIVLEVNNLLKEWDLTDKKILLTPVAQNMAINGLLSCNSINTLAIDFGHSFVKSSYVDKQSIRQDLKQFKIELDSLNQNNDINYAQSVLEKVKISLIHIILQLDDVEIDFIKISIAAYINNGMFIENFRGAYCKLISFNNNAEVLFSNLWKDLTNKRLQIEVKHDGNSSALLLKHSPGAIIMFGTSLGYGFS